MTTRKTYVDLTMPISEGMPTNHPDHFAPSLVSYANFASNGWQGSKLTLDSHCGTHLDAPAHFVAGGATVENVNLDCLIGPCCIIDMPTSSYDVPIESDNLSEITQSRVLLRTGWSMRATSDAESYFRHHPYLTLDAAHALVRAGVRLVGIDTPSVDQLGDSAHQILLQNNVVIIENLVNLSPLPDQFDIIILPLPIVGGDGCPVRAVAVLEEITI